MIRLAAILTGVALLAACGHMGTTPHPLYDGLARPAQEVAVLSGPIATVDGVDVSRQGTLFSLLPGCHLVVLQSQIGEGGVSGAWSADIPKRVYAFRMKAGNSYAIDASLLPGNHAVGTANVGGVKITAVEQDSRGKKVGTIAPARSEAEIESCQAWAADTEVKPGTEVKGGEEVKAGMEGQPTPAP
jgi:hypothetical protein